MALSSTAEENQKEGVREGTLTVWSSYYITLLDCRPCSNHEECLQYIHYIYTIKRNLFNEFGKALCQERESSLFSAVYLVMVLGEVNEKPTSNFTASVSRASGYWFQIFYSISLEIYTISTLPDTPCRDVTSSGAYFSVPNSWSFSCVQWIFGGLQGFRSLQWLVSNHQF